MTIIYEPKGKAGEFSHLAINHYIGCDHKCQYCYVPHMPPWNDKDFYNTAAIVRPDVLSKLRKEALKLAGTDKRVLLSFMCDPYQPLDSDLQVTRRVIEILRVYSIPFQILTKGGAWATRDFDLYGPHDAFAVTLTFLDADESKRIEPGAASPQDRMLALEMAKEKGIETWVSLEPVIDAAQSLAIIEETHKFVDLYKIGAVNYFPTPMTAANWRKFGQKAIGLCRDLKCDYFIKHGLAKYLDGVTFCNSDNRTVKRPEPTTATGRLF